MAMQGRRGKYEDFDPDKLLPGEWATVTSGDPHAKDGRAVYKCFAPGDVKRMTTHEDVLETIDSITADIQDHLIKGVGEVTAATKEATAEAKTATSKTNEAAAAADAAARDARTAAQELTAEVREIIEEMRGIEVGDLAVVKIQLAKVIETLNDALGTV